MEAGSHYCPTLLGSYYSAGCVVRLTGQGVDLPPSLSLPSLQLDEVYIKRSQLETDFMNEKHDKEMETLTVELEANMREIQEIQVRRQGYSGLPVQQTESESHVPNPE